jgi:hypothetical protein
VLSLVVKYSQEQPNILMTADEEGSVYFVNTKKLEKHNNEDFFPVQIVPTMTVK